MRRNHVGSLLSFVLAAAVAACGDSVGVEGARSAPVVRVLDASAVAGATVSMRMDNTSLARWGYNPCSSPSYQRLVGDVWSAPIHALRVCTAEMHLLGVADSRTVEVWLPTGLEAGTYRLRFSFLRADGEEAFPVSNGFTIE